MISHDFLDAQHTLRGRGCTTVEMTCSVTLIFPVVHAKVCSVVTSDGVTFKVLSSLACHIICLSIWSPSLSVEDGGSATAISEVFFSHILYIGSGSEHRVKPCKKKRSGPLMLTAALLQQLQPAHGEVKGNYCHGKE